MWPKQNEDRWYASPWTSRFISSATLTGSVGDTFMLPIIAYQSGVVEAMGVYKLNATSNATTYRLAIYNTDTDGLPGTVLTEFGVISLNNSNTGMQSVTGSAALVADKLYWLALKADTHGAASSTVACHNTASNQPLMWIPSGWEDTTFTSGWGTSPPEVARCFRYNTSVTSFGNGAFGSVASYTPTVATVQFPVPWFTFNADDPSSPGWAWHTGQPRWSVID